MKEGVKNNKTKTYVKITKWLRSNPSGTNAAYLSDFCSIVGLRFANPTYENLLSDCIWHFWH